MELHCKGAGRTVYRRPLHSSRAIKARFFREDRQGQSREPDSGDLLIKWTKINIQMGGNYAFELRLSREEIAEMFVAAFEDIPLDECLDAISRARA